MWLATIHDAEHQIIKKNCTIRTRWCKLCNSLCLILTVQNHPVPKKNSNKFKSPIRYPIIKQITALLPRSQTADSQVPLSSTLLLNIGIETTAASAIMIQPIVLNVAPISMLPISIAAITSTIIGTSIIQIIITSSFFSILGAILHEDYITTSSCCQ